MARGTHLEERGKRTDDNSVLRQHAYLNVATKLNEAVHKGDYVNDITKKEVSKMIDKVLVERKGVVGKGGYMERSTSGRVTRGLKRAWDRNPPIDFDGSLSEWSQWRKASEAEKERIAKGGAPKEPELDVEFVEDDTAESDASSGGFI
jgi:hypothetical protein